MSNTTKGCSNLTVLTEAEYDAELARLGLTREQATRPTRLELLIEFEQGRLSYAQYLEALEGAR